MNKYSPPTSPQTPKSHMQKYWWVYLIVTVLLSISIVITLALKKVFFHLTELMPMKQVKELVQKSDIIEAHLGKPISINDISDSNLNTNNGEGFAKCTVGLKGPKDSGTLYFEAKQTNDKWEITLLRFKKDNSDINLDLLQKLDTIKQQEKGKLI